MTWDAGLIYTSFSSNSKAHNFHFPILLTRLPIIVTLPELVLSRLIAHDTIKTTQQPEQHAHDETAQVSNSARLSHN